MEILQAALAEKKGNTFVETVVVFRLQFLSMGKHEKVLIARIPENSLPGGEHEVFESDDPPPFSSGSLRCATKPCNVKLSVRILNYINQESISSFSSCSVFDSKLLVSVSFGGNADLEVEGSVFLSLKRRGQKWR